MMAFPTMTNGFRARSERRGGGGTCSGSSAARGLRGEMGGLSLIDATFSPVALVVRVFSRKRQQLYARLNDVAPNTANRWLVACRFSSQRVAGSPPRWCLCFCWCWFVCFCFFACVLCVV